MFPSDIRQQQTLVHYALRLCLSASGHVSIYYGGLTLGIYPLVRGLAAHVLDSGM